MDIKFGKLYAHNNGNVEEPKLTIEKSDSNFFSTAINLPKIPQENEDLNQNNLRMNDFESNILENSAYLGLPDEVLKIEHKIDMDEKLLAKITQEIETLQAFEEEVQLEDLINQKKLLELEIEELCEEYAKYGLSAKLSGKLASIIRYGKKAQKGAFSNTKKFIVKKVLSKLSKKFKYSQNVKDALQTLENINSDVDELVKMNVPYGEKLIRYDRLTAYLNKANVIHAQITKDLKILKK
ncbi:hypothetical protein KBA27_05050 [bacterium]|nr:hypothetical protein [bacterium]